MLVHAHPDDESINNGVTMARYVDEGAAVTLVTCTLGEEGEVLVPDLAHLAAEHSDVLGEHRLVELKAAMDILGVSDYVRLGGDHRFRDSGMAWSPEGTAIARDVLREGIFWTTDLLVAASPADRRTDGFRTLRKSLGYCWSVAVAADPERGLPVFLELPTDDRDVAWVVRENRSKKRLAGLLPN